jgi:FixJ family two-component response regulator
MTTRTACRAVGHSANSVGSLGGGGRTKRLTAYTKVYWIVSALLSLSYVPTPKMISIIDDDESVREGLSRLLNSAGFVVNAFASAETYLSSDQPGRTDCLLLDVRMPGKNGVELERRLAANHSDVPVIFITAHGEEIAAAQALDGRVRTVLIKPFSEEALLNAIDKALTA